MRRNTTAVTLIAACLLLGGCPKEPMEPEKPKLTPEEAAEARRTLVAFLECDDCVDNELEAVKELGEIATPTLLATLEQGASPASRALLERELEVRYGELVEYAKTHPEAPFEMSREEFLQTYLDNYDAQYRTRSAEALAAIGSEAALAGLQKALETDHRPDVREAIGASLERMPAAKEEP